MVLLFALRKNKGLFALQLQFIGYCPKPYNLWKNGNVSFDFLFWELRWVELSFVNFYPRFKIFFYTYRITPRLAGTISAITYRVSTWSKLGISRFHPTFDLAHAFLLLIISYNSSLYISFPLAISVLYFKIYYLQII